MEREELMKDFLEERVLPLRLPSLSMTLALNFEHSPTVLSV